MTGEKLRQFVCKFLQRFAEWPAFLAFLLGTGTAWVLKETLHPILFGARPFADNFWLLKGASFCLYLVIFSLGYQGLFTVYQKFRAKRDPEKKINTRLDFSPSKRLAIALGIVILGLVVILFVNQILPAIHIENWTFSNPKIIPTMDPVGSDFRTGLYQPPHLLLAGEKIYYFNEDGSNLTQYPPLVNLFYLPFQLLNENQAYLLHVILLFFANLACLAITAFMVRDFILPHTGLDGNINHLIASTLFLALAVFTITSYPFIFSIERGNYDIIALLFALLAINCLLRKPDSLWVQVILLSIAVHLKIYPAALFVILLIKHGKKVILPALLVNIAFLLVLGPQNAATFLQIIRHNVASGFSWIGNHSGFSFATCLSWIYPSAATRVDLLRNLLTVIPILLWCCAIFTVFKHKPTHQNLILLLMATLPLMDVVPPISHDYKSVILNPALFVLLALLLVKIFNHSSFWDYFQLALALGIMLILSRSFALNPESFDLINNKFMTILLLESLLLFNLVIPEKETAKFLQN